MKLKIDMLPSLPGLSWCAIISKTDQTITVLCGKWVETADGMFFEGAWNGLFGEYRFDDANVFFGSGGRLNGDRIIFSSPTHTLERIFVIKQDDHTFVSNSFSMLLSVSSNKPDLSYISYQADYDSVSLGLNACCSELPLDGGNRVRMYCYCNIAISKDLSIQVLEKKQDFPEFPGFRHYCDFLTETIKQISVNANAEKRARKYVLLATASSGYDSACIAALAKDAGCEELLTFEGGRTSQNIFGKQSFSEHINDSGEQIGKILGYKTIRCLDRNKNLEKRKKRFEIESFASGNLYYDPTVTVPEIIQQRILLTGHFGDVVWDKGTRNSERVDLAGGGLSGSSLYEARLRIGFIHAPVPYIAGVKLPDIRRISHSAEMADWVIGNNYDKPIARRILEEKGVPRHLFGQKKKALDVGLMGSYHNIRSKMTADSAEDFKEFYSAAKRHRNVFSLVYHDCITGVYAAPVLANKILRKLKLPKLFSGVHSFFHKHLFQYSRSGHAASFLFVWGLTRMKEKYDAALREFRKN